MAASVEQGSEHPVGRAVVAAARERFGALPDVAEFDNAPGLGVRGVVSELAGDVIVAHAVLERRFSSAEAFEVAWAAEAEQAQRRLAREWARRGWLALQAAL